METAVDLPLRDVEDLHDADLDLVLADRLEDHLGRPQAFAAEAAELALLIARDAARALSAHALRRTAGMLAPA